MSTLKGNEAESLFVYEATKRYIKVSKPLFTESYDYIIDTGFYTYKVQVKYVNKIRDGGYRIHLVSSSCNSRRYSPYEVDFFVVYIKEKNTWYVFPVSILSRVTYITVRPHSNKCKYFKYLEAWDFILSDKPTI